MRIKISSLFKTFENYIYPFFIRDYNFLKLRKNDSELNFEVIFEFGFNFSELWNVNGLIITIHNPSQCFANCIIFCRKIILMDVEYHKRFYYLNFFELATFFKALN